NSVMAFGRCGARARPSSASARLPITPGMTRRSGRPRRGGSPVARGPMERMFARMAMLALVAAPLGPRPIAAGVIRGVVHVSAAHASAPTAFQAYPGHANALPDAAMDPRGAPSDAVVYLESFPSGVDDSIQRAPAMPQLAQKGQRFAPRVLPIAAGTTVDFPNMDPIFHNVFSLSPVKRFDLGRYPR